MLAILALGVPWFACIGWMRRLTSRPLPWTIWLAPSAGLALGLTSVAWWFLLQVPIRSTRWLIVIDLAVWTAAAILIMRWRPIARPARDSRPADSALATWLAVALFLALAALAAISFGVGVIVQPHGTWDAWAIWNLRARFLFLSGPANWHDAFAPNMGSPHTDYPLLVPLSVARLWTAIGRETVAAPIAVAATFACSVVSLAAGSIARTSGRSRGLITAAIILTCPTFVSEAAAEIADLPLAFYMLATFVAVDLAMDEDHSAPLWITTGLFAGLAAWTKNEGSVFLLTVLVVVAVWFFASHRRAGVRTFGYICAGTLPAVAALASFHMAYAPRGDVAAWTLGGHFVARLRNTHHLNTILSAMGHEAWYEGATTVGPFPIVCLFLGAAGVRRPIPRAALFALATVAIVIGIDLAVYATTSRDLAWLLSTSLSRVLLQPFPTMVWSGMMIARRRSARAGST